MHKIGELEGEGRLAADGQVSPTKYHINVWEERPGGLKSANGQLYAGGPNLYYRAGMAKYLTLQLATGEHINIIITCSSGDEADITVSVPVPGFQ